MAVPDLIQASRHEKSEVWTRAILTLEYLGPDALAAAGALEELVRSDKASDSLKEYAALALLRIQTAKRSPQTLAVVQGMLGKGANYPRAVEAVLLVGLDGSTAKTNFAELLSALKTPGKSPFAQNAVVSIGLIGKDHVPALLKELNEADVQTNARIVSVLEQMGPEAIEALPTLRKLLQDDAARPGAIRVLTAMGEHARPVVPDLFDMLTSHPNLRARHEASFALARIGVEASYVPKLVEQLKSADINERGRALRTLGGAEGLPADFWNALFGRQASRGFQTCQGCTNRRRRVGKWPGWPRMQLKSAVGPAKNGRAAMAVLAEFPQDREAMLAVIASGFKDADSGILAATPPFAWETRGRWRSTWKS